MDSVQKNVGDAALHKRGDEVQGHHAMSSAIVSVPAGSPACSHA